MELEFYYKSLNIKDSTVEIKMVRFQVSELCQDFLEKYGSHVSTGTVHFGGTWEWKSEYDGVKTSDSQSYKQDVREALKVAAEASGGGMGVSVGAKGSVEVEKGESTGEGKSSASEQGTVKTTVTQV